jgi:phage regulator Rha-like protein
MSNVIALTEKKHEARVDSRILAECMDTLHRNVMALIDKNKSEFEEFGRVAFETRTLETNGDKQKQRIALLNEDQSYFLLTLTRNTEPSVLKLSWSKPFHDSGSTNR